MKQFLLALFLMFFAAASWAQQSCQRPDKVTLFWDAPATGPTLEPVDHIEIHRADSACAAAGTFTKVAQAGAVALTVDDVNVTPGQTYCWRAFSFAADGRKSGPSNDAECAVPLRQVPVVPNLRAQ